MGTKHLGWPVAGSPAARFLALTLSVSTVAIALSAGPARAADPRKSREKMVELNKQALLSYEAKDFETARDLLTKALKEAKASGLEDDKMTARTYLHLGAVYWAGFQDQAVAIQNFSLAKKIRPDIQLTPSIETPDLKSVFDMATAEVEPEPTAPTRPTPTRPQPRPVPVTPPATPKMGGGGSGEPDLPTSYPFPLLCAVPDMVPPNKETTIRCALKPGLNARQVQIHYRTPGVEAYQALGMRKTARGWYIVTLPSSAMKAGTLQVYFDARDAADNELATNGQIDSPSIIEVRKKGGGRVAGECPLDDPLCKARRDDKEREYEAGLHRRREGAVWIGVGGGAGWGFVPAGKLEWERHLQVSAMTTTAGLFHVLPEVGYMWTDNFAIALQGRLEFMRQDQAIYQDPSTNKWNLVTNTTVKGAPTTMAAALFGRAIWYIDLSSGGNFRLSFSGDVGGGYIRFPVKPSIVPKSQVTVDSDAKPTFSDPSKIIYLTDTRPVGLVLLGASSGFVWHLSRHFALALEARFLTGLPAMGAVIEGQLSVQLAFGGTKGPPTGEEDEGEVIGPGPEGGGDAPPAAEEPPTSDLGMEEE
jgi:hypothetical protein